MYDFVYLVDYGRDDDDLIIPDMNPIYNTCTYDEAVLMANNANIELAQQNHAIRDDEPDDEMVNTHSISDPTIRPQLSEIDGDISEGEHDI